MKRKISVVKKLLEKQEPFFELTVFTVDKRMKQIQVGWRVFIKQGLRCRTFEGWGSVLQSTACEKKETRRGGWAEKDKEAHSERKWLATADKRIGSSYR